MSCNSSSTFFLQSGKDGLEFHDSGGDDVLFDQSAGQTHTFTNFPSSAVDDDEETEDKAHVGCLLF